MATDFSLLWRIALIRVLSEDTALKVLVGENPVRIYDNVPEDSELPYIRVGDDLVADYGDKDEAGQDITATIHFYDGSPTERGQERMNKMQARVYDILHERVTPIVINIERSTYLVRFIDRIVRNNDGTNWHGIDRYRVLI